MKKMCSHKLTDVYEELVQLRNEGKLSFAGQRELEVAEYLLFGKKSS